MTRATLLILDASQFENSFVLHSEKIVITQNKYNSTRRILRGGRESYIVEILHGCIPDNTICVKEIISNFDLNYSVVQRSLDLLAVLKKKILFFY